MAPLKIVFVLTLVTWSSAYTDAALILNAPTERSVLQRNAQNEAEVVIDGTFTGAVTAIEARAVTRAGFGGTDTGWQVIDSAPSSGAFSSSLTVAGGWYDLEVRTLNGATPVDVTSVARVGVGEVFITAGQSNSANHGAPTQAADDDRISARTTIFGNTWQHADDPQPIATGSGGSPWPQLGDLLAAELDVPVGFVSVGVGSTQVSQWLPGTNNYDNRLQPAIESLGADGFRAILWHQGESDSLAGTAAATYANRLNSIIAESRSDAGFDVPWGVALASFHPGSSAANEAQVFAGQQTVIAGDPLVFEGATTDGFLALGYLSDTVHFNQQGLDEHAARWFAQLDSTFFTSRAAPEPSGVLLAVLSMIGAGAYLMRRRRRQ